MINGMSNNFHNEMVIEDREKDKITMVLNWNIRMNVMEDNISIKTI